MSRKWLWAAGWSCVFRLAPIWLVLAQSSCILTAPRFLDLRRSFFERLLDARFMRANSRIMSFDCMACFGFKSPWGRQFSSPAIARRTPDLAQTLPGRCVPRAPVPAPAPFSRAIARFQTRTNARGCRRRDYSGMGQTASA